ncbi:GMP/IMP nucleotidase [Thiohalocapsa marina]|uniref:GMP/IMP nucleotidase n=1 Tax=Thiohalocapsa marina TaxID=424902 RepID=A0A5M8FVI7_9GAMM|nr:GMP/IMP nucleotidase [Thiohalocapsa marina]KAA6187719.1 GMP/IMP nucleotidase [Thiohalocapsa marina]
MNNATSDGTPRFDWDAIDTVFLDMDGTLLDLYFDNHFWLEHVPRRYAEKLGLSITRAKEDILPRYRRIQGTLDWYCVDHWSRELGLDIATLKSEVDHLIAVHPFVLDFLDALQRYGKRRVLVTNAHQKSIALKLERTRLQGHLEHIVCAHDLALPKEAPGFWERVQGAEPFDPARTLFVDDNLAVLRTARNYGFRWLLAITAPDSRRQAQAIDEFPAIARFSELLPQLRVELAKGKHHGKTGG